MKFDDFLEQVQNLAKSGKQFKPHKHVMLLCAVQMIGDSLVENGQIYFDKELKKRFKENLKSYGATADRNRPCNPFFHLRSCPFWKLVPNNDNTSKVVYETSSVGGESELLSLVSYACIGSAKFGQTSFRF